MRRLVAWGAMRAGAPVPSVRDLARQQRINPNTVAKAYQRLVEAGLFETRRGEGTFVASRPPAMSGRDKEKVLREAAQRFVSLAVTLGVGLDGAVTLMRSEWPQAAPTSGGKR